jgi:hypothetical protein
VRTGADQRFNALTEEHEKIIECREKLEQTRKLPGRHDVSAGEALGKLGAELEQMPDSVHAHYRNIESSTIPIEGAPKQGAATFESRAGTSQAFAGAAKADRPSPAEDAPRPISRSARQPPAPK